MERFSNAEVEWAQKSLASIIGKHEKVYATLSRKTPPRIGQTDLVARNLRHFRVYLALVEAEQSRIPTDFSAEELKTAPAAIPSYMARVEAVLPKFRPGTP